MSTEPSSGTNQTGTLYNTNNTEKEVGKPWNDQQGKVDNQIDRSSSEPLMHMHIDELAKTAEAQISGSEI